MELNLNELRVIKNALKGELRTVSVESKDFIDIKKSLIKIKNEIERIDYEIKQKACDEVFKALNQIFRPILFKKEDTCQNQSLEKAISYCIENFSTKEATKRIIDYIKSDRELNEQLRQPLVSGLLPLDKLQQKLDEALSKETRETLIKWLDEKRK